jgi:plastocyanin
MRTSRIFLAVAAALATGCGGGGAAPITGADPGEGGNTPGTPPPTVPGAPGAPTSAVIDGVDDAFRPPDATITAGGTVTWRMIDEEHDVTWSGAAPPGGDIGRIDRGRSASRTFSEPGAYAYSCARHKGRHGGVITVTGGGGDPPTGTPPTGSATVTTPGESFSPTTVTITSGGTVTWEFTGVSRHNVTFTGAQPPGGNVPDTDVGGRAQRQFPSAGSYPYRCTRHAGMTGEVIVQP